MIYSGMNDRMGYRTPPAAVGCSQLVEPAELPTDIKKATVEDLIACVLSERGAFDMRAADALRLGARLAGKDGWKEIPLAAWARFVSKHNVHLEASQTSHESYKLAHATAASVDKIG